MSLEFQITVFTDPQGEAAAKVYVVAVPTRDVTDEELAAYRLSGTIVGPTCKYSSTLQTKIPFHHRGYTQCGRRTALLAEATVPDPCYWSPELPFLYRAVGEVSGDATGQQPFDQIFGIRSVGTSRNRLTFNGQVWVPRGVRQSVVVGEAPLTDWRELSAVLVADEPSEELCRAADEAGVIVLAHIRFPWPKAGEELKRLSRHPSVVIAALEVNTYSCDGDTRRYAPNILLAQIAEGGGIWSVAPEAQLFITTDVTLAAAYPEQPYIILRKTGQRALIDARMECDALQRDLSFRCDVAGFVV